MESENKYMNEASILVKLEHENVAKLLGYCIEGTSLFLVGLSMTLHLMQALLTMFGIDFFLSVLNVHFKLEIAV
ncbi:putative protein kinase RLK-Pelle-RLCK-Pp family [Helianthus anomalus]